MSFTTLLRSIASVSISRCTSLSSSSRCHFVKNASTTTTSSFSSLMGTYAGSNANKGIIPMISGNNNNTAINMWSPSAETLTQQQVRNKHTKKTNSGMAKRFRVRGNGTIVRKKSGAQHNTGYKARHKANASGQSQIIKNKKVARKTKICMGIFGK